MPFHVGFTGTRLRLSTYQLAWLEDEMRLLDVNIRLSRFAEPWLHHGDCVGADAAAHKIGLELGWKIWVHPPLNESNRAFSQGASRTSGSMKYLARDRLIVKRSVLILAAPGTCLNGVDRQGGAGKPGRSGTWYTALYAMEQGKEVRICPVSM